MPVPTAGPLPDAPLFPTIREGTFLRRLNRFVVECRLAGRLVQAHLPNPGRLWELLLPGTAVGLVENEGPGRRLAWTLVSAQREGRTILLHTQKANRVVQSLLEDGRVPGLAGAQVVATEARFGASRFDFLLRRGSERIILEVKSCTLFGRRIAMFPDAVTERGTRHLTHLAELSQEGFTCGVLFLVQWPRARLFLPDFHTDLSFARAFQAYRDRLFYKPIAVSWDRSLRLDKGVRELAIPWRILEGEAQDRGSYIFILHLAEDQEIAVGSLGYRLFPRGHYLYVGSARRHLAQRLSRHLRRRKKNFWHIDYLRERADHCLALPIRSSVNLEHALAAALGPLADWTVPRFGASDCRCGSHLFAMHGNPLQHPLFISLLEDFRINRLTPPD